MARKLPDYPDLAQSLTSWFARSARDLPWRRTRDPYAIWVSEIMLQQTQVRTVIPYWERWIRELPDVSTLAQAAPERVLKLWEGLGYYSRARNLQRAAQIVMRDFGGEFPTQAAAVLELPGIGPYTAGAILSIAFNQSEPILDGNVIRVLTRVFALQGNPRERKLNRILWDHARKLVLAAVPLTAGLVGQTVGACSALNQSLMELGATICTPDNPTCPACPLQPRCRAFWLQRVDQFPETAPRPAVTSRRFATAVLEHRGKFLVRQRPSRGVNAGFWEFPNLELNPDDDPCIALAAWLGIPSARLKPSGEIRHSITRYRMIQLVFRARVAKPGRAPQSHWVSPNELATIALTAAHRRLTEKLELSPGR